MRRVEGWLAWDDAPAEGRPNVSSAPLARLAARDVHMVGACPCYATVRPWRGGPGPFPCRGWGDARWQAERRSNRRVPPFSQPCPRAEAVLSLVWVPRNVGPAKLF